jgi:hypothetical protein
VSQSNLNNAAAETLERFGVLWHTPKLDALKLVAQKFLRAIWKTPKILFRVSEPNDGPQHRRVKPGQITPQTV